MDNEIADLFLRLIYKFSVPFSVPFLHAFGNYIWSNEIIILKIMDDPITHTFPRLWIIQIYNVNMDYPIAHSLLELDMMQLHKHL